MKQLTDIRPALRERLADCASQRAELHAELRQRLEEIERAERLVKALLDEEERRFAGVGAHNGNGQAKHLSLRELSRDFARFVEGRTPLAAFLLEQLRDGAPKDLQELVDAAQKRGFQFGDKSPGRAIHFALTGMAQNGLVERVNEDRTWRIIGAH